MKYLIMTEGTTELVLINILIEQGYLKFLTEELLDERAFVMRQIKNEVITLINTLPRTKKVKIIRVGDKLSDRLPIPKDLRDKILKETEKCCTLPELEILFIIDQNLYDEYNKVKSKMKPKEFAKKNIKINGKRYNATKECVQSYFKHNDIIECLRKYHQTRIKMHEKDELCIYDLLRDEYK